MNEFKVKYTAQIVGLIGEIERISGAWESLEDSSEFGQDRSKAQALIIGAKAVLSLDSSIPTMANLATEIEVHQLETELTENKNGGQVKETLLPGVSPNLNTFVKAHQTDFDLSDTGITYLFLTTTGQVNPDLCSLADFKDKQLTSFRNTPLVISLPAWIIENSKTVFPASQPFLIPTQTAELLEWTAKELESQSLHPLLAIGVFHLLFLQTSPFPSANVAMAHLLTWRLLSEHGYSFVEGLHFVEFVREHASQYFAVLRQAERSARQDWATLNIWLEYFLRAVLHSGRKLLRKVDASAGKLRLTQVQQQIVNAVRNRGIATRELVASDTQINLSTVKYNLSVLTERGHLRREGAGRTTSYRSV